MIRERAGIELQGHQMVSLRRAVRKGAEMNGHRGSTGFLAALFASPGRSPEFDFLLSEITVGESYFFRDAAHMDFLRHRWLPRTIDAKRRQGIRCLRLWSAGCADGQEAYTLAILLREALPPDEDWAIHLLGTDIDAEALARAARGRYTSWSLRDTPDGLRHRFFDRDGKDFVVRPAFRRMATFAYLNLRDNSFPSVFTATTGLDLILCRNVFIYFSRPEIGRVIGRFADCLVPGGVLLTGPSDPVENVAPGLTIREDGGFHYFERTGAARNEIEAPHQTTPETPPWPAVPRADESPYHPPRSSAPRASASLKPVPPIRADAAQLLAECRWREALVVAESRLRREGATPAMLQVKMRALANLGRLEDAMTAADLCLEMDALDDGTYLLRGQILLALDQPDDAEAALRRALYLDPARIETHYHLAMLLLRRDRKSAGRKSLENARALAEQADPSTPVPGVPGMTHGQLAEALENDVEIYAKTAKA